MHKMNAKALATVSALALVGCKSGEKAFVDQVAVERSADKSYLVSWKPAGAPVDIYVSDQANAPEQQRRLLIDDEEDGKAAVRVPGKKRPYFYVVANGGSGLWAAERVLPLEGGRNFRDLGGYKTTDGRRVKWGKLYRSGTMSSLTAADYQYLADLGIRSVCDLRSNRERDDEPNKWVKSANIAYWSHDYVGGASSGDLKALLPKEVSAEQMKAVMVNIYQKLPFEHAAGYRKIFQNLAGGQIPLAFNCSAGKDRAGLGAALILSALGVPDDTVVADYAMSAKILNFHKMLDNPKAVEAMGPLAKLPRDVVNTVLDSDPEYIKAAFTSIRGKHGSIHNYLRSELGITDNQLVSIKARLLE